MSVCCFFITSTHNSQSLTRVYIYGLICTIWQCYTWDFNSSVFLISAEIQQMENSRHQKKKLVPASPVTTTPSSLFLFSSRKLFLPLSGHVLDSWHGDVFLQLDAFPRVFLKHWGGNMNILNDENKKTNQRNSWPAVTMKQNGCWFECLG